MRPVVGQIVHYGWPADMIDGSSDFETRAAIITQIDQAEGYENMALDEMKVLIWLAVFPAGDSYGKFSPVQATFSPSLRRECWSWMPRS